eukprot:736277-Amphidinium_carterae.1
MGRFAEAKARRMPWEDERTTRFVLPDGLREPALASVADSHQLRNHSGFFETLEPPGLVWHEAIPLGSETRRPEGTKQEEEES